MIKGLIHTIVSVFTLIAIITGSLAQFHYHSHDGEINIAYGVIISSLINQKDITTDRHEGENNHENKSTTDNDACSLKLNTLGMNNDNSNHKMLHIYTAFWLLAINNMLNYRQTEKFNNSNLPYYYRDILTHLFKVRPSGLRAPPYMK